MDLSIPLLVAPFIVLGFVAVGYGIARAFRARLVIDNELVFEPISESLYIQFRCVGFGEVKPIVYLMKAYDHKGSLILPGILENRRLGTKGGIKWNQIVLKEELPPISATLFCFRRGNEGGRGVALENDFVTFSDTDLEEKYDFSSVYFKVEIHADKCQPCAKWYKISRTSPRKPFREEKIETLPDFAK